MLSKGHHRYNSSPSWLVWRGDELSINKEIPASKRHMDYGISLFKHRAASDIGLQLMETPSDDEKGSNRIGISALNPPNSRLSADFSSPPSKSSLRRSAEMQRQSSDNLSSLSPISQLVIKNRTRSIQSNPTKLPKFPRLVNKEHRLVEFAFSRKPRPTKYQPYSLEDFQNISYSHCRALGGLGPSRVGTKAWEHQRLKQKKMQEYCKRLIKGEAVRMK